MFAFLEVRTVPPCKCNRYEGDHNDDEADIKGRPPVLPIFENSQGPSAKPSERDVE